MSKRFHLPTFDLKQTVLVVADACRSDGRPGSLAIDQVLLRETVQHARKLWRIDPVGVFLLGVGRCGERALLHAAGDPSIVRAVAVVLPLRPNTGLLGEALERVPADQRLPPSLVLSGTEKGSSEGSNEIAAALLKQGRKPVRATAPWISTKTVPPETMRLLEWFQRQARNADNAKES